MSTLSPRHTVVCHLGRMPYEQAWRLQQRINAFLVERYRSGETDGAPNVFLTVEHPPVFTLGKSGRTENLLVGEDDLQKRGIEFFHIGRGGDITFHGPGQLVGYPILDLHRFSTDLGWYLRTLEEMIIRTCADFGIEAARSDSGTGVWIGDSPHEKKICAMGIRCSRWVTMHGFAFNLNTDLSYFDLIVPCGIRDRSVTSVAQELGHRADELAVRHRLVRHFSALFDAPVDELETKEARRFLDALPEVA